MTVLPGGSEPGGERSSVAVPAPDASQPQRDVTVRPARLDAAKLLFASADFRNYWGSSAVFGFGIWGYITAQGWVALELTDDAWRVSIVSVFYFLPMFLFALPMGVVADSWDRRKTTITARLSAAILVVVMTVLAATDHLTYPLLLIFAFLIGVSIIAEIPARQAYVGQIVPPTHLMQAAALTEVQGGISRFLGPLTAGWLLHVFGPGGGFGMFAATNFLFVWFFYRIKVSGAVPRAPGKPHPLKEMIEGFRYLGAHKDALSVALISIGAGVFGWTYLALMPLMAKHALHGDAVTNGILGMAVGLGSVPLSLTLATSRNLISQGRAFVGTTLVWACGVILFSVSRSVPLSVAALFIAGFGFGGQAILQRALLLRIVDRLYQGRVFGTMMLTWGANIIGTLGAGALARNLGVPLVIGISGAAILTVVGCVVAWNPRLLRI